MIWSKLRQWAELAFAGIANCPIYYIPSLDIVSPYEGELALHLAQDAASDVGSQRDTCLDAAPRHIVNDVTRRVFPSAQ